MLTRRACSAARGALPMGELRKAGLIAGLAAAGACCHIGTAESVGSGAPTTQAHPIMPAPAFKPSQLTPVSRADWVTNGGNLANQRYSALDQINRDNVSQVKAVWRASLR